MQGKNQWSLSLFILGEGGAGKELRDAEGTQMRDPSRQQDEEPGLLKREDISDDAQPCSPEMMSDLLEAELILSI